MPPEFIVKMIFKLIFLISGLVQILEQIDKFNLKPDPAKGLVKGAALIVSIMPKDQVPYHIHRHIIIINVGWRGDGGVVWRVCDTSSR